MPTWPKKGGKWEYKGEDDECHMCQGEKLPWRGGMWCVVCDNRDDGDATWFNDFAEHEASGDS